MKIFLSILLMICSIPIGLYLWLKWGWYDGFVLAYNSIMVEPKNASDFAWGIIKILLGGALGGISFWLIFLFGAFIGASK